MRAHDKGDRTAKSDNVGSGPKHFADMRDTKVSTAAPERKGFRIQKKKSITTTNTTAATLKRRPSSKASKKSDGIRKSGYNEGAEETKVWMAEEN